MHSDRQKLQQVLSNLVGNAVKFTESGRIRIEAAQVGELGGADLSGLVFLDGGNAASSMQESMQGGLAIAVSDTGLGIREHDLSKLAIDFQQVNSREASKYGGTGLGLSLSRKLAGLLGGRIAVQSRYGQGSTFTVLLPASEIVDAEQVFSALSERRTAEAHALPVEPLNGESCAAAGAPVDVSGL
jgi:signal transduction histidine kinase